MNAFEQLVSEILWRKGLWVQTSVKVNLTPEDKVLIGRPTSPRWELDIVAYSGKNNILQVVECKSYLDSRGVVFRDLNGENSKENRYKLFSDDNLRKIVFKRLKIQLAENGACLPNAKIRLRLACGKIATNADRTKLKDHFSKKEWELWDEDWLYEELHQMSKGGYENQISAVVAKLLFPKKLKRVSQ